MQALKDKGGKWSSKRIIGMFLMLICVTFAFIDFFTDLKANEFIFGTLFGGALALLGVETVVNGITNRNNQRRNQRGSNFEGNPNE